MKFLVQGNPNISFNLLILFSRNTLPNLPHYLPLNNGTKMVNGWSANNIKAVFCHVINHISLENVTFSALIVPLHIVTNVRERELVRANKSVHKHASLQLMLIPVVFTLHPLMLLLKIAEYISLVSLNNVLYHFVFTYSIDVLKEINLEFYPE